MSTLSLCFWLEAQDEIIFQYGSLSAAAKITVGAFIVYHLKKGFKDKSWKKTKQNTEEFNCWSLYVQYFHEWCTLQSQHPYESSQIVRDQ